MVFVQAGRILRRQPQFPTRLPPWNVWDTERIPFLAPDVIPKGLGVTSGALFACRLTKIACEVRKRDAGVTSERPGYPLKPLSAQFQGYWFSELWPPVAA